MNQKINDAIKRLHRAKLVPALISIAFGIALIIARQAAMDVAVKIAAGMLIACGVGCVLMYFFAPVRESMQLGVGAFMLLIGFIAWFNAEAIVHLFPIFAGISLTLNGMSNFASLKNPEGNPGTWLVVLFSALMIAGGVFIIFHPASVENMLMVYIGICYIINGIFDVILLYRVKNFLLS